MNCDIRVRKPSYKRINRLLGQVQSIQFPWSILKRDILVRLRRLGFVQIPYLFLEFVILYTQSFMCDHVHRYCTLCRREFALLACAHDIRDHGLHAGMASSKNPECRVHLHCQKHDELAQGGCSEKFNSKGILIRCKKARSTSGFIS